MQARDYNLEFRQAANDGKLDEVKRLLENKSFNVGINEAGAKSGNAALHNAAAKGHYLIVEYLVSKGADIDLKNNSAKKETALDLASNHETKMFLTMVKPLREAIDFAKSMFPEKPKSSDRFCSLKAEVNELRNKRYYEACQNMGSFQDDFSKMPLKDRAPQGEKILDCANYSKFVLGAVTQLEMAKEQDFKEGYCGLRSTAAFVYLSMKGCADYPVEDIAIRDKVCGGDHGLLLIGRDPKCPLDGLNKNYAIFCDPFKDGKFYSSCNVPLESCVSDIIKEKSIYNTTINGKPSFKEAKFRTAPFEKCWNNAFDSLKSLLPKDNAVVEESRPSKVISR
jgi:hypothetical protein